MSKTAAVNLLQSDLYMMENLYESVFRCRVLILHL